ncbi:hypothetical protein ACUNWD_16425 [Sunxiuqinia sp. A32]|uniref:hypothetical protein n=1 Tax=Sunxiuqinia sp. A32 TaxID=3461496 RepID=UPI004045C6AF
MKTILTMLLLVAFTTLSFGGDASLDAAKKSMNEQITTVLKKNMKPWDNYFYKNDINKVKEDVELAFYVNEDQTIKVLHVKSGNPDAVGYVKHVLKKESFKVNKVLAGKTFRFNLHLRYDAS